MFFIYFIYDNNYLIIINQQLRKKFSRNKTIEKYHLEINKFKEETNHIIKRMSDMVEDKEKMVAELSRLKDVRGFFYYVFYVY